MKKKLTEEQRKKVAELRKQHDQQMEWFMGNLAEEDNVESIPVKLRPAVRQYLEDGDRKEFKRRILEVKVND